MGGASIWHWIVVGLIVMLLFGRGKVSELMGDVAKGIKSFKKGMADDDDVATTEPAKEAPRSLEHQNTATVATEESTVPQKKAG
jgi:sec-independent protein translocase protein TatA